MIAHTRTSDGAFQPLTEHCKSVAALCQRYAEPIGLGQTARLIGLLHDMGKATRAFDSYLRAASASANQPSSPHRHAPTGAIYAYRQWFAPKETGSSTRMTAQLISLCILGHHAGLCDCLDEFGQSPYLEAMREERNLLHYDEAVGWFLTHVATRDELTALFFAARTEINRFLSAGAEGLDDTQKYHRAGLLCRLLLSLLVDADRWDSACFEYGQDALAEPSPAPDWNALLQTFECFRETRLDGTGEINRIRAEISDICYEKATSAGGIVTLSVPTGGGKTFSSLRFALRHAALHQQRRIFYIIPYNTILDQNAADIREALDDYPSILEHHANVVPEPKEGRTQEEEQEAYRRLTECWDSDIILTSMVQFLNACYAAPNTDARRLHRLTNAVLIFDEIQALPTRCRMLFERAIGFLSTCCGCTIVLCTATQPSLDLSPAPVELMPDVEALCARLKRVRYIPELGFDTAGAPARIAQMLDTRSVLAIINTKAAALGLYQETTSILAERGVPLAIPDLTLAEDALAQAARSCPEDQVLCVYLSTLLCPAHRKRLIARIKAWLRAGKRVLCVSTQLIEAGVNVSFPVVVRSLAGLPSIVQAAGRANRSMEYGEGEVYIWDFQETGLNALPDIQHGADSTRSLLGDESFSAAMDTPASLRRYLRMEENYIREKEPYPIDELHDNACRLLSGNDKRFQKSKGYKSPARLMLRQSFRSACSRFEVIPEQTRPVLVPFMEGAELIAALNGRHSMREEMQLLRRAQAYSVSLYPGDYDRLCRANALYAVGESGAVAVEEGYYSEERGLQPEKEELLLLQF